MSGPSNDSPHQLEVDVFSVVAEDDYLGDSVTMEHTHGLLTTPWVITGQVHTRFVPFGLRRPDR